jgi:hypothetical protein
MFGLVKTDTSPIMGVWVDILTSARFPNTIPLLFISLNMSLLGVQILFSFLNYSLWVTRVKQIVA